MPAETDIDQFEITLRNRFHGFEQRFTLAQLGAQLNLSVVAPITLSSGQLITAGAGTPEGAVTAPVGSLYLRSNGGANTTLYIKESGAGNTGWVAK